jgi:4'-phosphopantetheinyl transferase
VSISHSAERVAVACARRLRIGVDVEYLGRDVDPTPLLPLVLNPYEVNGFRAHGATERDFRRYWTCKEAVLKATGDGLSVPLPDLTISDPAQPLQLIDFEGRHDLAGRVVIAELQVGPEYVACLAAIGDVPGWERRADHSSDVGSAWFRQHDAGPLLGTVD